MGEVQTIYNFDLITECDDVTGECDNTIKNTEIILALSTRPSTIRDLSYDLKISPHIIQLAINRMIKKEVVKLKENRIVEGRLEKVYELTTNNIRVHNQGNDTNINKNRAKVTAMNFSNLATRIIDNISNNESKPNDVRAMFIKVAPEKIVEFKSELEILCNKFAAMEELDEDEMYGFITLLGPYSIDQK
ncbi:hypothetical protein [Clostridium sp. 'White wine YQ']|uniref:hypothetical protein n=1 Tax=Clostridium sp. 'White wine YQ' TaxID=3027474 RepID=UPI00236707D8|nr:hypothetical protein [Clostridium sp. 'White wine YQ']MDD7795192.1 hypothetical protein [Clostridium sp. 'White wine YQ']